MAMIRVGTFMMAAFTVLWASWAWSYANPLVRTLGIALAIAAGVLAAGAVKAIRGGAGASSSETGGARPRGASSSEIGGSRPRGAGAMTLAAIAIETVAIIAVVRWLGTANPDLIQPAIALIVGAHFIVFQLSPATRGGIHVVMAFIGATIGIVGILLIHGDRPADLVHALVGAAMAAVTLTYGVAFLRTLKAGDSRYRA